MSNNIRAGIMLFILFIYYELSLDERTKCIMRSGNVGILTC